MTRNLGQECMPNADLLDCTPAKHPVITVSKEGALANSAEQAGSV